MEYIDRAARQRIEQLLGKKKVIVVLGARQTGKSTLLKEIFPDALWFDGDEAATREIFTNVNKESLRNEIGTGKTIIIDEAQRIANIGLAAKIIADHFKDIQLVLSGSSSIDIANQVNEPLTGRKFEVNIYPFSFAEMANHTTVSTEKKMLDQRLIYGYYPEVVIHEGQQEEYLAPLTSSYLYKDILTWERIQKPEKIQRLLQALAFQVGQMVTYNELAQVTGLNVATVERYIDLLEQAFIIYKLSSFSRNLRNELNKSRKIYFNDTGMRNSVINQYAPIALRNDIGGLWENFIITERQKYLANNHINCNRYFWRTKDKAEIDYIEERNGELFAYEFKWQNKRDKAFPKLFTETYSPKKTMTISKENYAGWLMGKEV